MKILALSTSTPRGSAAVMIDGTLAASSAYVDLQGHAERIFEVIDDALARASLARGEIEAIACDIGPGSFTGVRVGVATAKGIAVTLEIPLIGVTSLEAMAAAAFAEGAAAPADLVMPAIDAKKSEVFLAAYDASLTPLLPPCTRPAISASFTLPSPSRIVVVGEIASSLDPSIPRGPAFDLPDALWIARLAAPRLASGLAADAAIVEPLYVRPPDAKLPG